MSLHQSVDFFLYCDALSEITHLDVDDIIVVVKTVFAEINAGLIDEVQGFKKIEDELHREMRFTSIIVPPIEVKPIKKQKVC